MRQSRSKASGQVKKHVTQLGMPAEGAGKSGFTPRSVIGLGGDLVFVDGISALLVAIIAFTEALQFSGLDVLRVAMGVPFVLLFPGYVLVCALFPKKADLEGVERLALSIGLSLAVVPIIGLALNYTPWGIRLFPILLSLFIFVLLLSVVAAFRRKALHAGEGFALSFSFSLPRWQKISRLDKLVASGLIAGIVVVGGLTACLASAPRADEKFTEFYVLGPDRKLEGYPTNLTLGESGTVILGVANHEYGEIAYTIVVRLENETIETIDSIKLSHEMKWEENFTFTPMKAGEKMKLEFLLFREGVEEPYRSLHLWITVKLRL